MKLELDTAQGFGAKSDAGEIDVLAGVLQNNAKQEGRVCFW